ncbi:conjugal transfer protein TraO [uncultured Fibrella sp.]|uniref:conjugal transfer protein TraO n=1 Tax=uncultured Fibrella sp. TaxID=1284596 RepID=UPI0035CB240D
MKKQRLARLCTGRTNLLLSCFLGVNLLLSGPAWAQLIRPAPRLSGQRFVEVTGGLADRLTLKNSGWHGSITTGRYNKNLNAWKWSISYVRKPLINVPADSVATITNPLRGLVEQFTIGSGRELTLHKSVFRTFLVRGQIIPFVGYESVRPGHQTTVIELANAPHSGVLAGADFGLEMELQPVMLGIRQRWSPSSDVGRWGTLFYVGVRLGCQ